jgi:sigma-B regulation protein RsbQ
MSITSRNNVRVYGNGPLTLVFAHGFGCDQTMWRYLIPAFDAYTIIVFDLVGSGKSDLSAYSPEKYNSLEGYAGDLLEIIDEYSKTPIIFVGHSVSAIIGLLACNRSPDKFHAQIMVSPSPRYTNVDDYVGGFSQADIEDLLRTMDNNYLGWSSTMAPAIMGSPTQPELGIELTNSFCQTDPDIAKHFAKVTFLSDHRADLSKSTIPALILQCNDDLIAPVAVGEYMADTMPNSTLCVIDNIGHCPHLSAPDASTLAIKDFLISRNL